LPRKLAIQATAGNKAVIVQMKAASVRKSAKEKTQAEELAKQFEGLSVSFQKRAGEHDQLFGSVTSSDIADAVAKKGNQPGPAPDPAPRATEDLGRVHRAG